MSTLRANQEWDQLRAQLAAAISGGADAAAQRDTALGLCKEREREIGTWMAENAELKRRMGNLAASHNYPRVQDVVRIDELEKASSAERSAHAATQGHLQSAREMRDTYHRLNLEAREELAVARKALEESQQQYRDAGKVIAANHRAHDVTIAELARSEARVKLLESALHQAWKERSALPANVCEEIRTVLRG